MAILLIIDANDNSTNGVIEWLYYKKKEVVGTTLANYTCGATLSLSISNSDDDLGFVVNGKHVNIEAAWYRLDVGRVSIPVYENNLFKRTLIHSLVNEIQAIRRALFVQNGNCKWLSNYESTLLNKVTVLREAKNAGLVIPDSLITSSRKILADFVDRHGIVISKAVHENLDYTHTLEDSIRQYVEELDCAEVASLTETFFPSFFQKRIHKEYDVRVFYLDGKCYGMAIFSQSIDFRSDYENHFRTPLKLPKYLEQKIDMLMHQLGLNTGSLDFVKSSEDGLFYFLEVNPNGQFEMVSAPCNYYLEREIANYLCCEN